MILMLKFVVQTVVFAVIAGIMTYNNILMKSKSYWIVMSLTTFLYLFGYVMGRVSTI